MNVSSVYMWNGDGLKNTRHNNPLLPKNIRGLIVGKSNCGKTTLLLNLLLQPDWLDYNHLYVFGKSLHQQEYQILKKGFAEGLDKQQLSNLFQNQKAIIQANVSPQEVIDAYTGVKSKHVKADFFDDCNTIPDPSELDVKEKNLLILDDCFLGPQNKAEAYYTRGRHNNCDTFYISQNYFRLPRQTIRENANFIVLFSQDAKNLMHIHADHCDDDMSLKEFKLFCRGIWQEDSHNFVTIDLSSDKLNGKYRKNLNCFYLPEEVCAK